MVSAQSWQRLQSACGCCRESWTQNVHVLSFSDSPGFQCTTDHPGFDSVRLNVWVLIIGWSNYVLVSCGGFYQAIYRRFENPDLVKTVRATSPPCAFWSK